MTVIADNRAVNNATTTELHDRAWTMAGITCALLAIHLRTSLPDLAAALHLVVAGATLGKLPVDNAGDDVGTRGHCEHIVSKRDVASGLVVQSCYLKLHQTYPFQQRLPRQEPHQQEPRLRQPPHRQVPRLQQLPRWHHQEDRPGMADLPEASP